MTELAPSIGVIVATYLRPAELRRCLVSLDPQLAGGDELIVVTRLEDAESRRVHTDLGFPVTSVTVTEPGVVYAENAGLAACTTEIATFIDDDAVAPPGWLDRIRKHFRHRREVGAVCGPVLPVIGGQVLRRPTKVWGRISWYGHHTGNTDRIPPALTECDVVRGCNMAFRLALIAAFDARLRGFWRFEDDAALTVKGKGFKVICDPELAVEHYLAPVKVEFTRDATPRNAFYLNHNNTYVLAKHFRGARRAAFFLYTFLVGDRQALGLARLLWLLLKRRDRVSVAYCFAALAGKCAGLRTLWMP